MQTHCDRSFHYRVTPHATPCLESNSYGNQLIVALTPEHRHFGMEDHSVITVDLLILECVTLLQGHILSHKARVRLFMCCFVSGMPIIEVGINDRRRRGKEVVRRHEIIPVKVN